MPRYFFDLHDGINVKDPEGQDFRDVEAAKSAALYDARELIQAGIERDGLIDLTQRIDVRDEYGAIVHAMHFEDAVTVKRRP